MMDTDQSATEPAMSSLEYTNTPVVDCRGYSSGVKAPFRVISRPGSASICFVASALSC